jgi:hypothetical protein
MAATVLEKPLGDLRREITDLRQTNRLRDYDVNKLGFIITVSKDSLQETEVYQQQIFKQLQQFEISLTEINQILRANMEEQTQLEQQSGNEKLNRISFHFCIDIY